MGLSLVQQFYRIKVMHFILKWIVSVTASVCKYFAPASRRSVLRETWKVFYEHPKCERCLANWNQPCQTRHIQDSYLHGEEKKRNLQSNRSRRERSYVPICYPLIVCSPVLDRYCVLCCFNVRIYDCLIWSMTDPKDIVCYIRNSSDLKKRYTWIRYLCRRELDWVNR